MPKSCMKRVLLDWDLCFSTQFNKLNKQWLPVKEDAFMGGALSEQTIASGLAAVLICCQNRVAVEFKRHQLTSTTELQAMECGRALQLQSQAG